MITVCPKCIMEDRIDSDGLTYVNKDISSCRHHGEMTMTEIYSDIAKYKAKQPKRRIAQHERLTKADIALLEKIFFAEIENRLPFQSKAKRMFDLEARQYVVQYTETQGRFPVKVTGWQLTHAGRLAYCVQCD